VEEEHEEKKESLEEVIEHANEVGFQTLEQKSHEHSFTIKEITTLVPLSSPLPPFKLPQASLAV